MREDPPPSLSLFLSVAVQKGKDSVLDVCLRFVKLLQCATIQ